MIPNKIRSFSLYEICTIYEIIVKSYHEMEWYIRAPEEDEQYIDQVLGEL